MIACELVIPSELGAVDEHPPHVFHGLGLIAPLVLETWGMKWRSTTMPMTAAASVLVLVGGVLLRVYILQAGYFAFPWSQ